MSICGRDGRTIEEYDLWDQTLEEPDGKDMRSYQQGLEKEEESDEEDETGNSRVKQGRKESCLSQYEDDAEDENYCNLKENDTLVKL